MLPARIILPVELETGSAGLLSQGGQEPQETRGGSVSRRLHLRGDPIVKRFQGVYPALVTPVDDRGKIQTGALRDLMDWHLEVGVDGFYIAGGTGEGLLLTQDQRRALTDATVRAADGRAPIIVHVGHVSTRAAVDLARHAASAGADAVSAIPPIYYGTDPDSIVGHYSAIASATPLPLIVYHIPAATHSQMTVSLMRELLRLPTVKGIKFSDYNHFLMRQIALLGSELLVYSGNDEVFLSGLVMGANGGIGLTYNFMPQLFVGIYQAFHAGDLARARELQWKACAMIDVLLGISGSTLSAAKVLLRHLGFEVGEVRRPIRPLTRQDTDLVVGRMTELGLGQPG